MREEQLDESILAGTKTGKVRFSQMKQIKNYEKFFNVQSGRYYVVLSLLDAETLRAAIHQKVEMPLFSGQTTAVRNNCPSICQF